MSTSEVPNWYEIPVVIPDEYKNWVKEHIPSDQVAEIPNPHITLLYGFDPKHYERIDKIVKCFEITEKDYTFKEPKKGDYSPVWLLLLESKKLTALFWALYETFPNEHTLIHGKFEPHVTLCWLKSK